MARRPRQIAHKAETLTTTGAALTSTASPTEATPGIDTHIQGTANAGAAFTSSNAQAESVTSPTNQMQRVSKTGNAYTSS